MCTFALTFPLPWAPVAQAPLCLLTTQVSLSLHLFQRAFLWPHQLMLPTPGVLDKPVQFRIPATTSIHAIVHMGPKHPLAFAHGAFYMKIYLIVWCFWILIRGQCLPLLYKASIWQLSLCFSPFVSLSHPPSKDKHCSFSIWAKLMLMPMHWVLLLSYKTLSDASSQEALRHTGETQQRSNITPQIL